VIPPWLTNHNRDLKTSPGPVTPPGGPLVKGLISCKPDWTIDLHYTTPPTPGRHERVT